MRNVASLTVVLGCLLALLTIKPAPAHAGKARMDSKERTVVRAVNRQRSRHGLGALRGHAGLARAADYHSWEMLRGNYFAHSSLNGGPFDTRVRRFARRRAVGETLAMLGGGCGRGSAARIVSMWMHSSGHRAILLSSTYRLVGIGARTGGLGSGRACVVTADFASRR